eukprot:GHVQ01040584.1.p1 GENE.GHVQ01040584.1~~GHVQ01040584.1.p1  ORF type:complete len:554 (+),score=82.70 GHVQ01040584.1:1326-2987(+)
MTSKRFQIVFLASEVGPWSKTGGLGEVMDGLPIALAAQGHRVMTIAPRWDQYYDAWDTSCTAEIPMGAANIDDGDKLKYVSGSTTHVRFFHCYKKKVDRVFVDHPIFLEKVWGITGQKYYGPTWGKDWNDAQVRFSLFARAALEAIKTVSVGGYPYGSNCVIICNDWHTALLPIYMHVQKAEWANAKICMLMHNMVYQGRFAYEPWMGDAFNLPEAFIQEMRCKMPLMVGRVSPPVDCVNWLRCSLRYADKLLTVSPSYAEEMMSSPVKGVELNEELRTHRGGGVVGILNGIKDGCSPSSETMRRTANLPITYDETCLDKRAMLKEMFQKKVGLPVRGDVPLFMFIGRLDFQKGVDILLAALEKSILPTDDVQVVMIGQGREDLVAKVTTLKGMYPTKFASELAFKGPDKYVAYAGSEFAMMCSRYEPCGLVQMEGMRFGVLPIATPTGGLKDTVKHMETGIILDHEIEYDSVTTIESEALLCKGIRDAADLFRNQPDKMRHMQAQAMLAAKGFTWSSAATQYLQVFDQMGVADVKPLCGHSSHEYTGEDEIS